MTVPDPPADARGPVKVLLAKSFIDSHDRAIRTIAMALRDAGMEVVLLDFEEPSDIVVAAVDEDVSAIGLSFMSGGQVAVTRDVRSGLRQAGAGDIPVVVGGTIRPFDLDDLQSFGVHEVFRGGESLADITATFHRLARS